MKPLLDAIAVVTATADPEAAAECLGTWRDRAVYDWKLVVVDVQFSDPYHFDARDHRYQALQDAIGPGQIPTALVPFTGGGVVPAFAKGVAHAFADPQIDLVVCLHDDVLIQEDSWDGTILAAWEARQGRNGHRGGSFFGGFGGGTALGDLDIYQTPYRPHQLARQGFLSNLRDAELHGARTHDIRTAVVFDGFCQIGTRDWFAGAWQWLAGSGIRHHAYDAALGCLARRAGVPGTLIPVRCHHYGGRTAVANRDYQAWAKQQDPAGDQGFWEAAHRIVYDEFKDVLPIRVGTGTRG